jgi:D-glycero-D-manno-heptose 1,7-bisphosphate phosphatase
MKAIFLDRDGVILNNSCQYYIWQTSQLEWVEGIFANLKMLSDRGFKLFVVSNQGGVSKGLYSKQEVNRFHELLSERFKDHDIRIEEYCFCPHHPDFEKCLCRKPNHLMIAKLTAKYQIDKSQSYFIGDSETDMEAARQAGICGIKITANQNMFPFISFLNDEQR